jgi:adenylate cyclase
VLNVTSRIQGLCNELNADLLVSSELLEQMYYPERYLLKSHGLKHLKGRSEPLEIFSIAMGEVSNNTKSKMLRKVI